MAALPTRHHKNRDRVTLIHAETTWSLVGREEQRPRDPAAASPPEGPADYPQPNPWYVRRIIAVRSALLYKGVETRGANWQQCEVTR